MNKYNIQRKKVVCRSAIPILSPREYYERVGDVNNVVFSYGASDTSICLGTANVNSSLLRA